MAFLAYVLRGSGNNDIKHYLELFPEACVRLLKDCPPEDVATRKVCDLSDGCLAGVDRSGTTSCYETHSHVGFEVIICSLY